MEPSPDAFSRTLQTANPLVIAELRRRLRKPVTFVILLAPVLTVTFLLYYHMLTSGGSLIGLLFGGMPGMPGMPGRPTLQEAGREVFEKVAFAYMWIALLTIPAVTAGSICREREMGTLELLRLSSLGNSGILSGKLLGGLIFVGLLLLSTAPVLFVARLFGGLATSEIFLGLLLSLVWALLFGMYSLFVSCVTERTRTSLLVVYGTMVIWLWLTDFAPALQAGMDPLWSLLIARFPQLLDWSGPTSAGMLEAVRMVANPLAAMGVTFASFGGAQTVGGYPVWAVSTAFAAVLALCFGGLSLLSLRLSMGAGRRSGAALRKRGRWTTTLTGSRNQLISDAHNAVFQKEIRTNRSGSLAQWVMVFVVGVVLAVSILQIPNPEVVKILQILLLSLVLLFMLIAGCVSGALTVITERENGTLLGLRMSELTPREIVHGKFWASYSASLLFLPMAVVVAISMMVQNLEVGGWSALGMVVVAMNAAVGASLGVSISVGAKKATTAVIGALLSFGLWVTIVYQIGVSVLMMVLLLGFMVLRGLLSVFFDVNVNSLAAMLPWGTSDDEVLLVLMVAAGLLTSAGMVLLSTLILLRSASNSLAIRLGRGGRRKSLRQQAPVDWDESWAHMGRVPGAMAEAPGPGTPGGAADPAQAAEAESQRVEGDS